VVRVLSATPSVTVHTRHLLPAIAQLLRVNIVLYSTYACDSMRQLLQLLDEVAFVRVTQIPSFY
jgi:hypothetical protein